MEGESSRAAPSLRSGQAPDRVAIPRVCFGAPPLAMTRPAIQPSFPSLPSFPSFHLPVVPILPWGHSGMDGFPLIG